MVFIGGPRQVGKTTYSFELLGGVESHPCYLNWDSLAARESILKGQLPDGPRIVFDEIHKFAEWRNFLKGVYDTRKSSTRFIVTGSARLDYYRKGGDSLQGRYHYFRLHPFTLAEIGVSAENLEALLRLGGFPEPLLVGEETFARRWRRERRQKILYDDLRDLERVREISRVELLLSHLPKVVGSPLSINSLKDLLNVAHESVENWITIFENLYTCFRISPYGSPRIRAVKKERKLYFWDWAALEDPGSRFENMVASHLLKYCHFVEDTQGYDMELRFIRDTDGREIDFVVLKDEQPLFAVECKTGEKSVSKHFSYFRERTDIPQFFQVHLGTADFRHATSGARILPFTTFCQELDLP